jgi:NADPH-dependent 2,4-dienoyl-CoA reductase/sulfur reductase-like enzyme
MSIYRNDSNTKGNGQADKCSAIVVGAGGAGLRAAAGLAECGARDSMYQQVGM